MSEKKAIFIINILYNTISVYFDTFFVFYFFQVANYEVLPLAKYYLTLYLFIGIGFFIIRKAIKKNVKVPYFRIGISLESLYIALIMLLKDNIINYIYLIGFIKGIAEGFYYYPKSILDTEIIDNEGRQKFDGILNIINKIVAIVIPLTLGVLLTFISYTNLGKIFFILFIVMFILSYFIKDHEYKHNQKFSFKNFFALTKANKNIKKALFEPLLSGLTYSSGVMGIIITLSKIHNFKTNLNLGFVDSLCAGLSLLACVLFALKIKKEKFSIIMYISGIVSFGILLLFAFLPNKTNLIFYLLIRNSLITMISLITANVITNFSNCEELNKEYKSEFYCIRDIIFAISRCFGYIILLIVCLTIGESYISYIMVIPAIAILLQTIIIGNLSKKVEG